MNLKDLTSAITGFSQANRPIRLRLSHEQGVLDDVLLVKRVAGTETLCGGLEYRLSCVSTNAMLPLKDFLALPIELQFVTDRGDLRSVCGIVAQAAAGQSDGGLATYQLVVRDALALMEKRNNNRVFRNLNEVEISKIILDEWRNKNPVLIKAFDFDLSYLKGQYPAREFTMQHRESDAAFLRRLWKRRGIAWFVRPGKATEHGSNDTPAHTLVLFDDASLLPRNAAGTIRYHRDAATEERAGITAWLPVRTLTPGGVTRRSWDYTQVRMMKAQSPSRIDQGPLGNQFAVNLDDYLVDPPHAGDDGDDYRRLGELRMKRHEYESKCFHGEGGGPALCVGEGFAFADHPEIDTHPAAEREFILTALSIDAENNLPKDMEGTVSRLFAANRWNTAQEAALLEEARTERDMRFSNAFTCVRRGIPIVPAFDPRTDLPPAHPVTAIVAGPEGEEVHCDEQGRIKLNFIDCRPQDHAHAQGAGASRSDRDSAWVRVGCGWAGSGYGVTALPRAGMEATVIFVNGDVDKPLIISLTHNGANPPPMFSHAGSLPGNKYLSGIKSKEVQGARYNQLRLDDTPGQISAQLASEHGHSELNLGWLTHPRRDGKGDARGEGAELRSDQAVAVRGAKGVLISADARQRASGKQLDRAALLGLVETLQGVQQQLSELSSTHHAEDTDVKEFKQLIGYLKQWEAGSNTEKNAADADGGKPIVALTAPAGAALTSQDNVAIGAQTHVDILSAGNTQLSVGRKLLARVSESISLFAHKMGIKLIAASGKIDIQTHKDDIEATSAKRIVLTAAEEIVLQAPKLRFVAQGAQVDIGGGAITQQSSGAHTIKSSSFAHSGPGGGSPAGVNLPTGELTHNQRVTLRWTGTNEPMQNQRYRITTEDGRIAEGRTDINGLTEQFDSVIPFGRYTVEALDD